MVSTIARMSRVDVAHPPQAARNDLLGLVNVDRDLFPKLRFKRQTNDCLPLHVSHALNSRLFLGGFRDQASVSGLQTERTRRSAHPSRVDPSPIVSLNDNLVIFRSNVDGPRGATYVIPR